MAWTSSPSHFWRFPSFARGQYHRTAPTHKIRNLSHFLKVYQRVEIYNFAFSTRWRLELKVQAAHFIIFSFFQVECKGEFCPHH
jgi:hypothetical protein